MPTDPRADGWVAGTIGGTLRVREIMYRRRLMGEMDRREAQVDDPVGLSDAELYRRHAGELVRYAAVLIGPDDADDVVATAFARCMSSQAWLEVADRRAYLFRAVENEARSFQRSATRRRRREDRVHAETVVEVGTPRPEVWDAVQSLSVRQRAVVYLAYWHDLTEQMIAEHLGIGAGSVRRHLARARAKLREVLDE